MNTSARPTNSAPSRKKKDASATRATAKLSAACISFRNVAAATAAPSVKIAMIMNAALLILRSDKREVQISVAYRARSTAQSKQRQSRKATTASRAGRARHNARQQQR